MSLIVGRIDKGKVILIGDSKLTYVSHNSNPFLDGCLKLYIVNPNLAFGFAGIVQHFEQVLPHLLKATDASQLSNTALSFKKEKNLDFDLLIAQSGDDSFYLLKESVITRSKVAHIGDSEAFSAYQKSFLGPNEESIHADQDRAYISIAMQPEPLWEDNIYQRMTSAFKTVIQNAKVNTVDGILVPLCTHNGTFQYMNYVDAISDPFEVTKVINSGRPIDFGTAEHGSFSVELCDCAPNGGSRNDLGFYFLQGEFGVIFPPSETGLRKPKIVKALNPAFWILNTSKEYGTGGVASGYMTPDHCGIAGETLLANQCWEDALFCYELGKSAKGLNERLPVFDRYMSGYAVALFNVGRHQDAILLLEDLLKEYATLPMCGEFLFKLKQAFKT